MTVTRQSLRPRSTPTREYRNHHLDSTRWRGVLTDADLELSEVGARRLDPRLRTWLEHGRHGTAA